MSRTRTRKHLSENDLAKRGGRRPKGDKEPLKTPKQTRANERAKLRKEHL